MRLILIALATDAKGLDVIQTHLDVIGVENHIAEAPIIAIPHNMGEALVFAEQIKPLLKNLAQTKQKTDSVFCARMYEIESNNLLTI